MVLNSSPFRHHCVPETYVFGIVGNYIGAGGVHVDAIWEDAGEQALCTGQMSWRTEV